MIINYRIYALQFKHPFGVSSNTRTETTSVFIRLTLDEEVGYGEACLPAYLGETVEETVSFLKSVTAMLNKTDLPSDMDTFLKEIDGIKSGCHAAKAAIDIALHDLSGKIKKISVAQMYQLPEVAAKDTSFTIGIDTEEMLAKK